MNNAKIIDERDSVVTMIENVKKGEIIKFEISGVQKEIIALDDILLYHKAAIKKIKKGDMVTKYGEYIGEANQDIKIGNYVHVHNISSVRKKVTD